MVKDYKTKDDAQREEAVENVNSSETNAEFTAESRAEELNEGDAQGYEALSEKLEE